MLLAMAESQKVPSEGSAAKASESRSRQRKVTLKAKVNYSEFSVHVLTWNVASAALSTHDVESIFLPQESLELRDLYNETDVVAVGLQEAYQGVVDTVGSVVGRDPAVEIFSSFLAGKG